VIGSQIKSSAARFGKWAARAAALLCAGLMVGCGALGALAYKFTPAPTIQAQYIPQPRPMLVLVEKSDNPTEARLDSERIGRYIGTQLTQHKVAPIVDAGALPDLRSRNPKRYASLSPADAGRAVDAAQVLFVNLVEFTIEPALASDMAKGRVEARVKVIDVASGQTLWPMDNTQGYALWVENPYVQGVNEVTLRAQLCHTISDRIAKLFYKWQSDQTDEGTPLPD
jgi:hypothetical protein